MDELFKSISACSVLIPLFIGILCYRSFDRNSKIMFVLILLALIPQSAALVFTEKKYGTYTSILYNCYALADPLIWSILFFQNIRNKKLKRIVAIIPVAQVLLWLYLLFTKDIERSLFKEMICFTSVIQVLWIVVILYELFKSEAFLKLETRPLFWFCLALIIYAPTTYFLFVFVKEIKAQGSTLGYLWNIHSVLNTMMYCTIAYGFWVNKENEFKLT
ncbi:hypothetical protein I5907_06500 [Panacibacter sp. DH6]|uniref:Uncharacterized protein n=1 Tax=Panacibacter microcysteis TaxID=2793269 RepID=A0A931DZL3_9BACT|nr:hypothetical protein [Panacibacter microcysteis]MBG9375877.1 hypothetical protein [Panacibacter microcysteis]